jgi:membrane-bound lytic murein transglycosylase D
MAKQFQHVKYSLIILGAIMHCSVILAQAQGGRYRGDLDNTTPPKSSAPASKDNTYAGPRIYAPSVPTTYTLFGEKVPLENVDIHDRFDRELIVNTYMQGSTIQIIKQMGRWMPMIEARLKANGVPDDFKYLCVAESALQQAVSRVGASGFWQFMKGTAPSFGLEVNDNIDERYNAVKSTDAACTYLKQAYQKLGSWTAAAASYNCGVGGFNGNATAQGSYNFYDLLLPEETMRYIFRIAALKYILENPSRSGYIIEPNQMYKPYNAKAVSVNYTIGSLIDFAKSQGTNYKTIKLLNPWLRDRSLRNTSGKTYEILVPNW